MRWTDEGWRDDRVSEWQGSWQINTHARQFFPWLRQGWACHEQSTTSGRKKSIQTYSVILHDLKHCFLFSIPISYSNPSTAARSELSTAIIFLRKNVITKVYIIIILLALKKWECQKWILDIKMDHLRRLKCVATLFMPVNHMCTHLKVPIAWNKWEWMANSI